MTSPRANNDNFNNVDSGYSNDVPCWGLFDNPKGSGCNDNVNPTPGLTSFLSCNNAHALDLDLSAGDVERIDIVYDYEIVTDEDVELSSSVNAFEIDLLRAVAGEFDLSSCEYGRRNLRKGRQLSPDTSTVGIGSYPSDVLDTVHSEFTIYEFIDI